MKKSALIGLSMTAVTLGVVGLSSFANAQTSASGTSLIDKIALKFNLKTEDVKAVFEADRTEREAERSAQQAVRLQALVDKGTITADQMTKIEAKRAELKAKREAVRDELESWATASGIDAKYLFGGGRKDGNSTDRLQALVDKGTITADQKNKIEAKQAELKTKREAERTALETWAKDNGIDLKYLMGGFGMGRGHGGPDGHMGNFSPAKDN